MSRRPGRILPALLPLLALLAGSASAADSPAAPRALLAGSWGQGLFRLAPGDGTKWEAYGGGLPQKFVTYISLDSKGTLYAGFDLPGVWLSKDFGTTWEKTPAAPPAPPTGIAAHPANPDILLVTTWGKGAWWTEDGGKTWTATESPSPFMRKPVVVSDGDRPRFLAIVDDGRIFSCKGVRGEWSQVAKLPRGLKAWDLAARDRAGRRLLVATEAGVAEISESGSVTFPRLEVPSAFARAVAVDGDRTLIGTWGYGVIEWDAKGARFVNADLANRNIFALALISGAAVGKAETASSSGPSGWTQWNTGLQSFKIKNVVAFPQNQSIMYCSTASGVHRSNDGGKSWKPVTTGVSDMDIYRVAVSPSNADIAYCCTWNQGAARTKNGGASWEAINKGVSLLNTYHIEVDPRNEKTLYLTTWGAGIFRSEDGGDTWKDFTGTITSQNGYFVFSGASSPNPLIASIDTAGLFLMKDEKWVDANKGMNFGWVMNMAQDPANGKNLLASTAGSGAYLSSDGGASWKQSNTGLTNQGLKGAAFHPGKPGTVYAGTDGGGVFKSTDGGATWAQDNAGLTSMVVRDVFVTSTGLVFLSTDNGIFVRQD